MAEQASAGAIAVLRRAHDLSASLPHFGYWRDRIARWSKPDMERARSAWLQNWKKWEDLLSKSPHGRCVAS